MLYKKIKMLILIIVIIHQLYLATIILSIDFKNYEDDVVRQYSDLQFKLITMWANLLLFVYCNLLLYYEWKTLDTIKSERDTVAILRSFLDNAFVAIIFPTNMFAGTYFWRIWHYDRHILVPIQFDTILPPYTMHSLHTIPLIVIILEFISTPRRKPRNHWSHIFLLGLYVSTYIYIVVSEYMNGVFIYLFIKSFTPFDGFVLAMSMYCEHFFFYIIQWNIGNLIWSHTNKLVVK